MINFLNKLNNSYFMENEKKHIAVPEATKERLATYLGKTTHWKEGIESICDFLDIHKSEFLEFKSKKK